LCELSLLRIRK